MRTELKTITCEACAGADVGQRQAQNLLLGRQILTRPSFYAYDDCLNWPRGSGGGGVEMQVFFLAEHLFYGILAVSFQLVGATLLTPGQDQGFLCARHLPAPWFERAFKRVKEAQDTFNQGVRAVTTKRSI